MELIPINESKLKIMLSSEDMTYYNLDALTLDYSDEETRKALKAILSDVKERYGYDTDTQKTYIQVYPCKRGGCEMFISKMDSPLSECDDKANLKPMLPPGTNKKYIKNAPKAKSYFSSLGEHKCNSVFSFDSLSDMLKVCRQLDTFDIPKESKAYCDIAEEKYYLVLFGIDKYAYLSYDEYSFISEYGCRENAEMMKLYIKEHCRAICNEDAISTLSSF